MKIKTHTVSHSSKIYPQEAKRRSWRGFRYFFFRFLDARVWGKHSAWMSTAKWRRTPRTVPALTLGQYRAEARTHFSLKGEIYWADHK